MKNKKEIVDQTIKAIIMFPKNPWDVMGCQKHLF